MTSNETKKQQAYDRLRKLIGNRVTRVLGLADEDLANLSLAQLINLLFLMHGDGGSTRHFNVSFAAALELVGADLIWCEPETERATISSQVQ
jgi:hypothetical protein